jgi:hypothetical protein
MCRASGGKCLSSANITVLANHTHTFHHIKVRLLGRAGSRFYDASCSYRCYSNTRERARSKTDLLLPSGFLRMASVLRIVRRLFGADAKEGIIHRGCIMSD